MQAKQKMLLFLCLIAPYSGNIFAQGNMETFEEEDNRRWYKPDYFKVQYAGNIGFMSLGLGYNWWKDKAQSDILYGYVPKHKGEAVIHTFTLKNTVRLYQFDFNNKYNLSPTIGFALSFEPGENSYMHVPEKYPNGYYSPNNVYVSISVGLKSNFKFKDERFFSSIDVYCEANTLGEYAYYNIIAQEDRSNTIFSLALGINVFF